MSDAQKMPQVSGSKRRIPRLLKILYTALVAVLVPYSILVTEFIACPMCNRSARLLRRFTRDGQDLRDLRGRERAFRARPRSIPQDLTHRFTQPPGLGTFKQREVIPSGLPPPSPCPDLNSIQADLERNVFIVAAFERRQDNLRR